jgi:hypothetical protein
MPRYEWQSPLDLIKLEQILNKHPAFTSSVVPVTDTTISINSDKHADRNIVLNHAGGVTATLPKASGTGDSYRFTVGVLATANSHIIKCGSTSDILTGSVWLSDTDTAGTTTAFSSGATSDTITLNRGTSGSTLKGEFIDVQDIANNTWQVSGMLANTGNGASPFGSTVN